MENDPETPKEKSIKTNLLTFAYELGIWIVVPLVILLFGGIWFDAKFHTKPAGTIAGLLLSLIPTGVGIAKKVKNFDPDA